MGGQRRADTKVRPYSNQYYKYCLMCSTNAGSATSGSSIDACQRFFILHCVGSPLKVDCCHADTSAHQKAVNVDTSNMTSSRRVSCGSALVRQSPKRQRGIGHRMRDAHAEAADTLSRASGSDDRAVANGGRGAIVRGGG